MQELDEKKEKRLTPGAEEEEEEEQEDKKRKSTTAMEEKAAAEPLSRKYVRIFLVVSLYWFVSITMVFVNKSLLSGHRDLDAPFFVTWFQCVVTVVGCYLVHSLSVAYPDRIHFPKPEISYQKLAKVLPLSVVFVLMITFNNLTLKFVTVSFYNVGRSLTTVFNVVFTYFILKQTTSFRALLCCAVIIFGFWLGVDQEGVVGTLSTAGVVCGVLASCFVSLNAIFTKKVLPLVDDNIWTLTLYNNINACFLFLPAMALNSELANVSSSEATSTSAFWAKMVVAGVFGFAIGYVTGLQIQVTSPLTHNISGTAKAAAQTVLATQIHSETKTVMWWVSNALVLAGSAAYARVRQLEMAARK